MQTQKQKEDSDRGYLDLTQQPTEKTAEDLLFDVSLDLHFEDPFEDISIF